MRKEEEQEENYQTIALFVYTLECTRPCMNGERAIALYKEKYGRRVRTVVWVYDMHNVLFKTQEREREKINCGCRWKKESRIHHRLSKGKRKEKKLTTSKLILYSFNEGITKLFKMFLNKHFSNQKKNINIITHLINNVYIYYKEI